MATVAELVQLLRSGARRLAAEVTEARKAGLQMEGLSGQADAFLLVAHELDEQGDPVALLEALYEMERVAAWTARLDEEQAIELESQGMISASHYHARSARYSHGLIEGYSRARVLLGTCSSPSPSPTHPAC
jgi:hypothetical protein